VVLGDLCTMREYRTVPGIHMLLRPKHSQGVPKRGPTPSGSVILASHREWVDMRDFIWLTGLCKNTFPFVPLMALDIISINQNKT
jgi:hypothetical protein